MPKNRANGMTMINATPAKNSEFRNRTKMLSETGRPVRNETPGSPRMKPFFKGIYSNGPPELSIQPVPIIKVQTFRSVPFSHSTAWF